MNLTLPFPPSVNGLYGGGSGQRRFKTKKYKQWENDARFGLKKGQCINRPIHVFYTFFFPDKRTRDIENYSKAVSDFLVNERIIEDDGHHIIIKMTLLYGGLDKKNPRVEIEIKDWP